MYIIHSSRCDINIILIKSSHIIHDFKALSESFQTKIPHKNIKNFTSDWNDGTAVAALVDAHAPGLCPEADTMDPNNALQNATYAMKLAEDWLGIPQV